jgi:hypothetical protein
MLGDDSLAQQITGLKEKKLSGEQLRMRLVDVVKTRINQIQKRTT